MMGRIWLQEIELDQEKLWHFHYQLFKDLEKMECLGKVRSQSSLLCCQQGNNNNLFRELAIQVKAEIESLKLQSR